jgi:hypothetical protein
MEEKMNVFTKKLTLTEKVVEFQETGKGFHSLHKDLCLKIYTYPKSRYGLTEDDCGNFYLYFLPQLKRAALKYDHRGKGFEHYFNSVLSWRFKSYLKSKNRRFYAYRASQFMNLWQPIYSGDRIKKILKKIMYNHDLSRIFMINDEGKVRDPAGKKQLLLFILQKAKHMDREDVKILAEITGYSRLWLKERVEYLRTTIEGKMKRLQKYRERRNRAFWRLKYYETILKYEIDDGKRKLLKEDCERMKTTLRRTIQIIAGIRVIPTHHALASALEIPKGTVDSCLIRLKKKLTRVYKKQEKMYA